jgi:hypothetical protein
MKEIKNRSISIRRSVFRTFLLFVILTAVIPSGLKAQGSGNKYAGEFLAIGVGGRPLGMGGAYVSMVSDVTAGYWNPGALARIDYPQA